MTLIIDALYYTSSTNLFLPKTNYLYTQIKHVVSNYYAPNTTLILYKETYSLEEPKIQMRTYIILKFLSLHFSFLVSFVEHKVATV